MLVSVADFIGVSIASPSRIVADVSRAIARLYPSFVLLESHTRNEFYNIAGFPRVHGVIDGTHILIQSPNSNIGEEFRNRKGSFSLNVQVVSNASLMFLNVVARWPGSTHDATIFNHSDLKDYCEQGGLGNRWLLDDSGYPCKAYLLTLLLNPITQSEQRYNEAHIKTRNTIERCIGVWKRRFPILALKCRLKVQNLQAVIIATAVLHNIARKMNLQELEPEISIAIMPEENNFV
ncbi:putative nuclease HARBI1, partial [Vanessa atalanta]|uniref:putative nuclease HARBI1 n=1 Tax=Vanessa atalanta TaxID=42275 RepID=UPI001FCDD80B